VKENNIKNECFSLICKLGSILVSQRRMNTTKPALPDGVLLPILINSVHNFGNLMAKNEGAFRLFPKTLSQKTRKFLREAILVAAMPP